MGIIGTMKRFLQFAMTVSLVSGVCIDAGAEPPQFGIEGSVGQAIGFTSYVDNVTYVADDDVFLANERADVGLALSLIFVFQELEVGVNARWFGRQRVTLTHRGDAPLPEGRIRPDGSADDSGIHYDEIESQTITVPDASRGSLLMLSAEGGYRLYFTENGPLDVWTPLSGGLVMTHVNEPQREFEFGLTVNSGIGLTVAVAQPISFFLVGRLGALFTPTYGNQDDANRDAVATGQSTPEALLSTLVFTSVTAGIQFSVR